MRGAEWILLQTLRLRHALPAEQLRAHWRSLPLDHLPALIQFEGGQLWLYRRLKDDDLEPAIEAGFRSWLRTAAVTTAARNLEIDNQVVETAEWLRSRGIPHVFLKGAAQRALADLIPYADARRTSDVDVLVPAEQARQAWDDLRNSGYDFASDPSLLPGDHFHLIPLVNRNGIPIELHLSTSRAVAPEVAWKRATTGRQEIHRGTVTLVVPSSTELLWHALAHAMNDGPRAYRLRYFLDVAALVASDASIDWTEIQHRLASGELSEPERALRWLGTAFWLAGAPAPVGFALLERVVAFQLERVLRWRLSVLRHWTGRPRLQEKLLEEATRTEMGWPMVPAVPESPLPFRVRRRVAATIARAGYRSWRILTR